MSFCWWLCLVQSLSPALDQAKQAAIASHDIGPLSRPDIPDLTLQPDGQRLISLKRARGLLSTLCGYYIPARGMSQENYTVRISDTGQHS